MDTSPIGLKKNWVTEGGGLPLYIRAVAHAFIRHGVPESRAIERAVGVIQDWSRGSDGKGGSVSAATQAKAAAALSDWEKLRATAHAHANDAPAMEFAFSEALHPRVSAGNTGGGRFTAGGAQQPSAKKTPPAKRAPVRPAGHGHAAQAHQLRAQAARCRLRAAELRTEARAANAQLHTILTRQKAARASAAKSAAAAASGKPARKVTAKPARKRRKATRHKKGRSVASLRLRVADLRLAARSLDTQAGKLDAQAGRL